MVKGMLGRWVLFPPWCAPAPSSPGATASAGLRGLPQEVATTSENAGHRATAESTARRVCLPLMANAGGTNFRSVPDPQLMAQFGEQSFEPLCIANGLDAHQASFRQRSVK